MRLSRFLVLVLVVLMLGVTVVAQGKDDKDKPKPAPDEVTITKAEAVNLRELTVRIERLQLEARALRAEVQLAIQRIEKLDEAVKTATTDGSKLLQELAAGKGVLDLAQYEIKDGDDGSIILKRKKE